MMTLHDAWRKRLVAVIAASAVLVVTTLWAISWLAARRADDSQELLRQALKPDSSAPRLVEGKKTHLEATSSSGEAIPAEVTTIQSANGKVVGHLPSLKRPPKDGEKVTLKLPGGGRVEITAAPASSPVPTTVKLPGDQP